MLDTLYAQLAIDDGSRNALSAKTISYIHTTIHKVLGDALDADLVGRNVAERVSHRGRAGARPPASRRGTRTSCGRSSKPSPIRGSRRSGAWRR